MRVARAYAIVAASGWSSRTIVRVWFVDADNTAVTKGVPQYDDGVQRPDRTPHPVEGVRLQRTAPARRLL